MARYRPSRGRTRVRATVGPCAQPHGDAWKTAARRAGADPVARYEGDDTVDAEYVLACPNGCFERGYVQRSKWIKNPWIESKYGYRTAPNFTTYEDRAESYIEKGRYRDAATIYRAMFEAMRDHLHEFDPHRGGFEHDETFQDAIASYATTIREANLPHEEKREYIEYCFDQWLDEHEEGGFPQHFREALWALSS